MSELGPGFTALVLLPALLGGTALRMRGNIRTGAPSERIQLVAASSELWLPYSRERKKPLADSEILPVTR